MIKIANFGCGVNSVAGILHYGANNYNEILIYIHSDYTYIYKSEGLCLCLFVFAFVFVIVITG